MCCTTAYTPSGGSVPFGRAGAPPAAPLAVSHDLELDGPLLLGSLSQPHVYALPVGWPERLRPEALSRYQRATPVLVLDTALIRARVRAFAAAFRGRVGVRFAVKCNPHPG